MKYFLFLLLISSSLITSAQADSTAWVISQPVKDTVPAYVSRPHLPSFSIQTADKKWFSRSQLPHDRPVLVLYFSPDCGHCMIETEEMISKMNGLKHLEIVMVTSREHDEMMTFSDHYKIERFSNVKIGRDPMRILTKFYDVKFTPFSALYDRNHKLIKAYPKGIDWTELIRLTK